MNAILVYPENEETWEALKAVMTALKIKFEPATEKAGPYNPEFVNMVLEAEQEIKDGKGLKVSSSEFDGLWK